MSMISKSIEKIDGMALAIGKPAFVEDLIYEEALCVKLLRSPYAFAKILEINTEKAKEINGVECILTYKDLPRLHYTIACESYPETSPYDHVLLDSVVRYVGDPVAIIGAKDEKTALKAIELIEVNYEVLDPILDFEKSEDNSIIIHPENDIFVNFDKGLNAKKNISATYKREIGDVEKRLKECDIVIDKTYYTQAQAHAMMETHRAFCYLDQRGRLIFVTSTQSAFHVQRITARALGIPQSKIRVIKPRVGGAFGGKNIALLEPYVGIVTLKTGKSAKLIYTRKECFTATNTRHAMKINVRLGADNSGIIHAIDLQPIIDTGAYGEHAPDVLCVGCNNTLPMYVNPEAVRYIGKSVYTNKVPAGAFRGFGAPQTNFAIESAVNELAHQLNMDPVKLREKNIIRQGQSHAFLAGSTDGKPAVVLSSTLGKCIERGKELIGWDEKFPMKQVSKNRVRGVGVALSMHGSGIANIDTAAAEIRLNYSGNYTLLLGAADLGNGSDTILCQMAAEILETTVENINVISADTDTTPYDTGAYASSTTYVTGNAVVKAAKILKEKIIDGAKLLCTNENKNIEFDGEYVRNADSTWEIPIDKFAAEIVTSFGKQQLSATAMFGGEFSPPPYFAGFAEVEVDLETGKINLINFVAVIDCGTLINPNLARIQAEGGIAQGIGLAMFEDVKYDIKGRLLTDSFMQYKIPCRMDLRNVNVEFIPSYEPTGPFGAKSIGEVVVHTPPAAISDAVYNATGVRIRTLPITPEKLLDGILKKVQPQL